MKLLTISLQNFKGIHALQINLQGEDANIYGDNATGKTTMYDAFLWLLFDKDSSNRKDFSIKPHGTDGKEIHHLETAVDAALLLDDGRRMTLRKVYREQWIKRRGEADRTFSGHETEYLVGDSPKKKNEYMAIVDAMIDEQTFKLITNPAYFNTMLSWQDRRQELFRLSGYNSTDDELIAAAPDFADLQELVRGRTIDDARSAAQYALKKIKDDIRTIPIRIDEINHNLPNIYELSDGEWDRTHQLRDGAAEKINAIDARLADARTIAQEHARKLQAVEDLRAKLRIREAEIKEEAGREIISARDQVDQLTMEIDGKRRYIDGCSREIDDLKSVIAEYEEKAPELRSKYYERKKQEFIEPDEVPVCGLCGQPLPAEMAAKDIDDLRQDFYEQRDAEAAAYQSKGKALKAKADQAEEQIKSYQTSINEAKKSIQEKEEQIKKLREIADQDIPRVIPLEDDVYTDLLAALKKAEADAKSNASSGTVEDLLAEKKILQDSLAGYDAKLASRAQHEAAVKRIEQLKTKEKELAAQQVEQERLINLIEKFISYKAGLIEEQINAMFPTARFRLFDTQINGGVVDCCDCMIGGVPYADANNAARINAGLEIIDVISRARGITAPIFIDNRESVNQLYDTDAQIINLVVTKDKTLRVETSKSKSEEVA